MFNSYSSGRASFNSGGLKQYLDTLNPTIADFVESLRMERLNKKK